MRPHQIIIVFAAILATTAHARIGETLPQIEARFGKPVQSRETMSIWILKDGMGYIVTFDGEGRSVIEAIMSKDASTKLTSAQVKSFLAAQIATGAEWKPAAVNPMTQQVQFDGLRFKVDLIGSEHRVSGDGKLYAQISSMAQHSVMVATAAGLRSSMKDIEAAEEADAVKF